MIKILALNDDMRLNQAVCTYLNDSGFQAKGCLRAQEYGKWRVSPKC